MRTNSGLVLTIASWLAVGSLQADEIYTTSGFENPAYTNGSVAGKTVSGLTWIEWDTPASVNNANPLLTQIQSGVAYGGTQALAVGDITNRVLARALMPVTNTVSFWDGFYKSEATNNFGAALITFRTDGGNKSFRIDGNNAWWDSSLGTYINALASGKMVPTLLGSWDRITIGIDLTADTYSFYHNNRLAFTGTLGFNATKINSWEIDVTANGPARLPKGQYAFYVDKLTVNSTNPLPLPEVVNLYVSPNGADSNPGTQGSPFKSLSRAKEAVRVVNRMMLDDIIVHLADGVYRLTEPLQFTPADSGFHGHQIIYRSGGGVGKASIRGSEVLAGWVRHDGSVWKVPVQSGRVFHTLYENGQRVYKARFPNYQHSADFPSARAPYMTSETGSGTNDNTTSTSWLIYRAVDFDPAAWDVIGNMKINIFPWGKADWHRWICSITEIDPATRRLTFGNLGDRTAIGKNARYFLEDHPAFLDSPGEFYLNTVENLLYYIPLGSDHPDDLNIAAPLMMDLFRLQGGGSGSVVSNLTFEGLDLGETDSYAPTRHWWIYNWGMTDHALIWMNLTRNIRVTNCRLANSGRHGVLMAGGNLENRVEGSLVEEMGVSGLKISNRLINGIGQGPSNPSERHVLTNNRIHNVGQLALYASCIGIHGSSSNEVSCSDLYNSPRYAVTMRGNTSGETEPIGVNASLPPASGNVFRNLRVSACGHDSGDMGALHVAGVNINGGPYINTFEQITVDKVKAVFGMQDIAPNAIFLDWPQRSMNQVFRNIQATNIQGNPFRSNQPQNGDSSVLQNVSWRTGFIETGMDFINIGVQTNYPVEFGGFSLGVLVTGSMQAVLPTNTVVLKAEVVVAPHLNLSGPLTYVWSVLSGPGLAELTTPDSGQTDLVMTEPGEYIVRVTVAQDGLTAQQDTTVVLTCQSFEAWAVQKGIPEGQRGVSDDPFGTGLKNLVSYATGLAPDVSGQSPLKIRLQGGAPVLVFPWRTDISPNTYFILESTTDFGLWNAPSNVFWQAVPFDAGRVEVQGRIGNPVPEKRFYRIIFGQSD